MTDVQIEVFAEKLPTMYASAFANHIISVNNKVRCNLLNAMDARSYICLPLFLQLCDSS